jgi:hypothetical protein
MDFITQLPTTPNGKTSVLTIVDSLSKRVRLIPTRDDVTAEGVAKLFFDFIVSQLDYLVVLTVIETLSLQVCFGKVL